MCRSSFRSIRFIRLYSALNSNGDSDGFWELFRAFWPDSALFVLFGSFLLDGLGRSFPYDTKKPECAKNAPNASPNPVDFGRLFSEYIPNMAQMKFVGAIYGTIFGDIRPVLNISKQAESLQECFRIPPEFSPIRGGRIESIRIRKFVCIQS